MTQTVFDWTIKREEATQKMINRIKEEFPGDDNKYWYWLGKLSAFGEVADFLYPEE